VELGELLVSRTAYARQVLTAVDGVSDWHSQPVVREFAVKLEADVLDVIEFCAERGVNPGHPLAGNGLLVAITEQRSKADIDRLAEVLKEALS
jgi:glycine dehydrogenase subunit 1